MNDPLVIGLMALLALALTGLGVKVVLRNKSGDKTVIKNVNAGGDVVGRDKTGK